MVISPEADGWIKIVGLVVGSGFGTKILWTLIETRDSVRDHIRDVGNKTPPTGLFKDIADLKELTGRIREEFEIDRRIEERRKQR